MSESYKINVLVRDANFEELYCAQIGKTFHIRHDLLDTHFGVFHEEGQWSVPKRLLNFKQSPVQEVCCHD